MGPLQDRREEGLFGRGAGPGSPEDRHQHALLETEHLGEGPEGLGRAQVVEETVDRPQEHGLLLGGQAVLGRVGDADEIGREQGAGEPVPFVHVVGIQDPGGECGGGPQGEPQVPQGVLVEQIPRGEDVDPGLGAGLSGLGLQERGEPEEFGNVVSLLRVDFLRGEEPGEKGEGTGEGGEGDGANPPAGPPLPPVPPITLSGSARIDTLLTGGNLFVRLEARPCLTGGNGPFVATMGTAAMGDIRLREARADLLLGEGALGGALGLDGLGAEVTETDVTIRLSGSILFDFDSSALRPDAERTLAEVAEVIRAYAGRPVRVEATVFLGPVSPEDILVQLYHGRLDADGQLQHGQAVDMQPLGPPGEDARVGYVAEMPCQWTGLAGYTIRILPRHRALPDAREMGLIKWA